MANAKNKDMAKEFLSFINDEEHLVRFTELTGGIRPFGGNTDADKASIKSKYLAVKEWGDFEKSTFDIYFDAEDLVLSFPRNYKRRGENAEPSMIYTYKQQRYLTNDYPTLLDRLRTNTVTDLVLNNSDSLYNYMLDYYRELEISYGPYMIKSL